jgi:predicted dehydrogenase
LAACSASPIWALTRHRMWAQNTARKITTYVGPHGATFEDGYRAAEVCDAIVRSAEQGTTETVSYRA